MRKILKKTSKMRKVRVSYIKLNEENHEIRWKSEIKMIFKTKIKAKREDFENNTF
mgnify:CR=1 FL=1